MDTTKRLCGCCARHGCCGKLAFLSRVIVGLFFIINGLYNVCGMFGGAGFTASVNLLRASDISWWLAYGIIVAAFTGGWSLLLGFCAEFGVLLVMPWWMLFLFFKGQVDSFFTAYLLAANPAWTYVVNALVMVFIPVVGLLILNRGSGCFSVWNSFFAIRRCCQNETTN